MEYFNAFKDGLVEHLPYLRGYASSLCRGRFEADDIVSETLVSALRQRESFQMGTNMKAWLFTILRGHYNNRIRYAVKMSNTESLDGEESLFEDVAHVAPTQGVSLEVEDVQRALNKIDRPYREALYLVVMDDLSYEEAAKVCGCEVGTIKSRVNRARKKLLTLLSQDNESELPSRESLKDQVPEEEMARVVGPDGP